MTLAVAGVSVILETVTVVPEEEESDEPPPQPARANVRTSRGSSAKWHLRAKPDMVMSMMCTLSMINNHETLV